MNQRQVTTIAMTTDTDRNYINSVNDYALAARGNSGAFIGNLFDEL